MNQTAVPTIDLSCETPVSQGIEREVYIDPSDHKRLIKILRPVEDLTLRWNVRGISVRLYSNIRTRDISKEYKEYLRLCISTISQTAHLPVAHMFGFVPTNKGMGCLTQRVFGEETPLAPTLRDLADSDAVGPRHIEALNSFASRIRDLNVRASDLKAHNVVFGHRYFGDEKAAFEAVLIDGFGDIHAIPVRTWSKWANRYALAEAMEKTAKRGGLTFDRKAWAFS